MRKKEILHWFNLIEVTLAVAIVGIGMSAVIALLPPSINANKTADFNNFISFALNNLTAYVEYQLKNDWDGWVGDSGCIKNQSNATVPPQETNPGAWKNGDNDDIKYFPGLYNMEKTKTDVFGIRSNDGRVVAHVRIWKTDVTTHGHYEGSEISDTGSDQVRITFEISWPVGAAYNIRNTKEYVFIFNRPLNESE